MVGRIGCLTSPVAGKHFALTEYSLYCPTPWHRAPSLFVVLRVNHEAANNLGSQTAQLLLATDIERDRYRNHFSGVAGYPSHPHPVWLVTRHCALHATRWKLAADPIKVPLQDTENHIR